MSQHLMKNPGAKNFLLAPRPLQLSLATLETMTRDGSITKRQLVDTLGCNSMDEEKDCSFLLNHHPLDDFGFFSTNIQNNRNRGSTQNSDHVRQILRYLDEQWYNEHKTTSGEVHCTYILTTGIFLVFVVNLIRYLLIIISNRLLI